jgi:6-phosphogluconolactonase (cycloisomerase 2 family)
MTLSRIGRLSRAFVASVAVILSMSACGGGTIGYMWVLGTQYNQIAGFQIDDFTGNLTQTVGSPYASGGTDPVSITVKVGGRYVYVVNKGSSSVAGNVAVFSVGDNGILTYQQTYSTAGGTPVWAIADGTGTYLFVLDAQAPDFATTGNGDITVFQIDPNTGRLQLVPNQQIKNASGTQLNYFEVGKAPSTMRYGGGACIFTVDADQTIFPYSVGGAGQLIEPTTGPYPTGAKTISSLNISGSNIFITDSGTNTILPYTAGTNCSLSVQSGGAIANLAFTANPSYSLSDSKSKYLYVLNQSTTNTTNANSTISAFTINPTTNQLQVLSDPTNPYAVGSGPVCMVEDPSNQYVYTSNNVDGTVTGKIINQNTGQLSDLTRGSSFTTVGRPSCLAVSGNVD